MNRLSSLLVAGALLAPAVSRAGEPTVGYAMLRYNGLGVNVRTSSGTGFAFERSPLSLDPTALSLAAGIGYNGWNAQLDILNGSFLGIGQAVLSVGYRWKMNFDNVEVFVRGGVGPNLAIDYLNLSNTTLSGGVSALGEGGVHYFLHERFGLGAALVGMPTFQLLGYRLIFEGSLAVYALLLI
jgi:hypothetical protein